ncbi:MAG: hypothetical protein ACFFD7_02640 [Candidatus Thorarchaeota archaeon]
MKRNTILWGILIVSVIVIFIFNQILAIWITLTLLCIALLVYLTSLSFKKKVIRVIQNHHRIIDTEIAAELNQHIDRIRKILTKLHKHQRKGRGLVIFLNKRYIYYNGHTVKKLLQLFKINIKEKEILEQLKDSIGIKTRAEVKVIKDTLINHRKIEKSGSKFELKDQIRESKIY